MSNLNPFIRLHSGRKFHVLNPRPSEITIEDIAHNLSHICRFTGACRRFYSVAEHCVLAASQAPDDLKLEVLMHDGSESVLQDLNSPTKSLLPQYQAIEHNVERMLARKFKFQFPYPPIVKEIDLRMLTTEMKQLLPGGDWKIIPHAPFDIKLPCWDSARARREFLKAFRRYS